MVMNNIARYRKRRESEKNNRKERKNMFQKKALT
jgi:hypothetical protein